ncbi:protein kinase [Spirillospora sp. NPDC048832]
MNVLLAADGPRVIDFGIARAADATPLTRTGGVVGSPQFMAPEQVRGGDTTEALDIFAFGSLLYFAATARSPFGEGNPQAVMFRIAQEEPRLDECPETLRPLVERCLDKNPANRPTATELLDELTALKSAEPASWPPGPVTESLRAHAAVPDTATYLPPGTGTLPTVPSGTGPQPAGPPAAGPHALGPSTPAPASPGRTLLLLGGGVMALLLVFAILVVISRMASDRNEGTPPAAADQTTPAPLAVPGGAESPSSSATPTPSAPTAPEGPGDAGAKPPGTFLGEYKGIDITEGYLIYFTDAPTRPRENEQGGYKVGDLSFTAGYLAGDSKFGEIESGQAADYKTCHDNTKYINDVYQPQKGARWCVYTTGGLLGIATVKSITDDFLTIDLKVWQGPAD